MKMGTEDETMELGAHLPLISFDDEAKSLDGLIQFAATARDTGYTFLCANDHLVFRRPWLDGPTALAAVIGHSGRMQLATTIALPIVRGPAPTAKWMAAIDWLSGGRLVAGIGPGSSANDYVLAGLGFDERWARLEECVDVLRAFFRGSAYEGRFYTSAGMQLEPRPRQTSGPPIWLGSWGGKRGLERTAQLADGWLASGYNTTPDRFARSLERLRRHREDIGKLDPLPNGIATMWAYVTDDAGQAAYMLEDVLAPMLNRPGEQLRGLLPIGAPEECASVLRQYRHAGAERVFLWPLGDEVNQLEAFQARVLPLALAD